MEMKKSSQAGSILTESTTFTGADASVEVYVMITEKLL